MCEEFNEYNANIINLYKAQAKQLILDNTSKTTDHYPWLEINDHIDIQLMGHQR